MAFEEYTSQISAARQNLSQRYADQPKYADTLRSEIYNREQGLPSLRENRDAQIKALYDADRRMSERYANQSSQLFIKNPYQREQILSSQHAQELGEIQGTQREIAKREDVLGDILQKGLDLYGYGLKASEFEFNALQQQLDNAMKIAEYEDKKRAAGAKKSGPTILQIQQAYRQQYDNAKSPAYSPKGGTGTRTTVDGVGFTFDQSAGWIKDPYKAPENPIFSVPTAVAQAYEAYPAESANIVEQMMGYQIKPVEGETWGYSQAEVAADVSGKPVTPQTTKQYQEWLAANKNTEDTSWKDALGGLAPTPTPSSATLNKSAIATSGLEEDVANYLANPGYQMGGQELIDTLYNAYSQEFTRQEIEQYLRSAGVQL